MMMIPFPSIQQFRHVVKYVHDKCGKKSDEGDESEEERKLSNGGGDDEDGGDPAEEGGSDVGEAEQDSAELPVIKFRGTVKLHGTNAAVCMNVEDGTMWAQSRERVLTPQKDNAGFCAYFEAHREHFERLFAMVRDTDAYNTTRSPTKYICIYGEWCGKGIQKNVGISNIPRSFFVFAALLSGVDARRTWIDSSTLRTDVIQNVENHAVFSVDIDFKCPQMSQNTLCELTTAVEDECPIAKDMGFSGIGEGIVWTGFYRGIKLWFKVKGEKHSSSKVKTLASVDVEKIAGINEFVESVVTESRVHQGMEKVSDAAGREYDRSLTKELIQWVIADVIKEESDTMAKNGINMKEVSKNIANVVRRIADRTL